MFVRFVEELANDFMNSLCPPPNLPLLCAHGRHWDQWKQSHTIYGQFCDRKKCTCNKKHSTARRKQPQSLPQKTINSHSFLCCKLRIKVTDPWVSHRERQLQENSFCSVLVLDSRIHACVWSKVHLPVPGASHCLWSRQPEKKLPKFSCTKVIWNCLEVFFFCIWWKSVQCSRESSGVGCRFYCEGEKWGRQSSNVRNSQRCAGNSQSRSRWIQKNFTSQNTMVQCAGADPGFQGQEAEAENVKCLSWGWTPILSWRTQICEILCW